MLIMTPSDENELRKMLTTGHLFKGPAAVRYPRGNGPNAVIESSLEPLEIGKGMVRRQGSNVAMLVFGVQLTEALIVAEKLDATVVDMRFVKPLDEALVREMASSHDLLVTIEENAIMGGAGAAVSEFLARRTFSSQCCTWACRMCTSSTQNRRRCWQSAGWMPPGSKRRSTSAC
jgi:1-deoxy-D-xylulose-5-phosphate synthase